MSTTNSNEIYIDYDFNNSLLSNTWDQLLLGSGSSSINDDGYIEMNTPAVGDRVVRQSKEYFRAKAYKYNTVLFTVILNTSTSVMPVGETGARSRVGIFDDKDDKTNETTDTGIFFEYKLTDRISSIAPILNPLYVGIRYNSTNNIIGDTLISQDNFNINKFNQKSNYSILEWSKIYTFEIKYNTIGYVEWSIYLDGERMTLHKEQNISSILNILPNFYMPLRFEIDNRIIANGGTNNETIPISNNSMRQFHASILYEYGTVQNYEAGIIAPSNDIKNFVDISDILFSIDNFTYTILFSFRLKQNFIRNSIKLYELIYVATKKGPFTYEIIRNGAPNNPNWIDPGSEYWMEYDINSNNISNDNDIIYKQLIDTTDGAAFSFSNIKSRPPLISSNIAGISDIFTIRCKKLDVAKISSHFDIRWVQQ